MRLETARLYLYPLSARHLLQAQTDIAAVCKSLGMRMDSSFGFFETLRKRKVYNAKLSILDLHPKAWLLTTAWYMQERSTSLMVGEVGFKGPPSYEEIEIGYSTKEFARGRGYMTEAVAALCQMAAAQPEYEVKTVLARTLPGNWASQRVLVKNGFIQAETGDRYLRWRKEL